MLLFKSRINATKVIKKIIKEIESAFDFINENRYVATVELRLSIDDFIELTFAQFQDMLIQKEYKELIELYLNGDEE